MTTPLRSRDGLFASRLELDRPGEISAFIGDAGRGDVIAFTGGFPDPVTFDLPLLAELTGTVLADPAAVQYGPTAGMPGLRDWLRGWIGVNDGAPLADAELMITSGGMEGLTLLNRCLVEPGDRVLVEAPTFMGALAALRHAEARVTAVPMDDEGLHTGRLAELLAEGERYQYLYLISDYQNPTGRSLSASRRRELVELARQYGLLIVEDVAYRELGFDGERLPSLAALAPELTVQLGTFAKTFMPGLRLGWLSGPAELVAAASQAKQYTDQCASPFGQRLLEEFGRCGGFDKSLAVKRDFYRQRRDAMLTALADQLPSTVGYTRPAGGFFTWLTLPDTPVAHELAGRAAAAGVAVLSGRSFYPDGRGGNELRLSFSKVSPEQITEGIGRLAGLIREIG